MSLNIDSFRTNINVLRPNLFYARLTLPSAIFSRSDDISKLEFRCETTELPGRTVATYDDQSTGTTKKLAYDVTYNDINLTIIASEDMKERRIFEKWINNIVNPSSHNSPNGSGGLVKYYDDYAKGVLTISHLNSNGDKVIAEYTMHSAYPIQVSPMNLSWAEFDTYQRFAVTMTYRYYTYVFF
jgi:hypothetical protein